MAKHFAETVADSSDAPAHPLTSGALSMPEMAGDDERRHALRKMKMVAVGLLLGAALVFLACVIWQKYEAPAWVGYVRATAEASMVGALADWFAVTALFRHPLGLKIPHTAIIPNKKDQIGESLGEFVQSNFLTGPVLAEKLRQIGVSERIGQLIAEPANARKLGSTIGAAIEGATEIMNDDDVQAAIDSLIVSRVRETPAAPIVAKLIDIAVEGGNHQHMMTAALRGMTKFLEDNKVVFRQKLAEETPEWVPNWVDDRIFAKMFNGVQSFIADVAADENHELRRQFDSRVNEYAEDLRTNPVTAAKVDAIKEDVLSHPAVKEWSASLWSAIKRHLVELSNDAESPLRQQIEATVMRFGTMLTTDQVLRHKIDGWVERSVLYVVEQYKDDVADLISGTVARWDTVETSKRIELQVGRDLQFIRINGTVIGGLAGLVIYTTAQLIG